MITSTEILEKLDEALKKFGTYSFDDKGPDEVMDIDSIVKQLKILTPEQAGSILKEVSSSKSYDLSNSYFFLFFSENNRKKRLAETLVNYLETMPDEWFEKMLEISEVEY